MDLNKLITSMKNHPRYHAMGMIATHLGVVRETSLGGDSVVSVEVSFDQDIVTNIIKDIENMPGIIKVMVETADGMLKVGDDIMAVAVGGDIREHVFPSLIKAVDRIKKEGVKKKRSL